MKKILGLLMVMGLMVGVGGCGKDSPTGATGPQGQTLEVWTEKYDNGKVEVEYQYYRDLEGKVVKHGYGKYYYRDGQVSEEGNYKDGKQDGKWVYYESSSSPAEGNIYESCYEMGEPVDCPDDE